MNIFENGGGYGHRGWASLAFNGYANGRAYGSQDMKIKSLAVFLIAFSLLALGTLPTIAGTLRIVALGDSLTAGYQLPPGHSFPARLQTALQEKGHDVEVINAGVSGDTSSGGLARFAWAVPDGTDLVIVELGANDALRGIDPSQTRKSLDEILEKVKGAGADALLTGMIAPPNMGPDYAAQFNPIYPELAKKHGIELYPFFLEGVAAERELNLDDGIHPNKEGVDVIVANILPAVEHLISKRISK